MRLACPLQRVALYADNTIYVCSVLRFYGNRLGNLITDIRVSFLSLTNSIDGMDDT